MLTRKQLWRRACNKHSDRKNWSALFLKEGIVPPFSEESFNKAVSEPVLHNRPPSIISGSYWNTTGDLANNTVSDHTKPSHTVKFDSTARVILVPSRKEYQEHGLVPVLWYDETDYKSFKLSALTELQTALSEKPGDKAAALRDLYQNAPSDEIRETMTRITENINQIQATETDAATPNVSHILHFLNTTPYHQTAHQTAHKAESRDASLHPLGLMVS